MKVLHVITGLDNGGAEAVLVRLVVADKEKGVEHHVISLMGRGIYAKILDQADVPVYCLNFSRGKFTLKGIILFFILVKRIRPNVIQTWMYHSDLMGGIISRLAGVRAIVWGIRHANLDPEHNSKSTLKIVRICAFFSHYLPLKIVSCSARATLLHSNIGYQADKFVQIPNGCDIRRFKPNAFERNAVRAELGITENMFVLGMVARFNIQKDHENLVSALGQLHRGGVQFVCFLVGADIYDGNRILQDWIYKAGISNNVKLLGSRNDIPAVMNALDIHVLSSLGEAFPNVLAESMACGTPCVTTDVGDAAAIVGDYGWVVSSQNASALAVGLALAHQSFVKDKKEWQRRQSACRSHIVDNFELEGMREKYRQVWEACMKE